MKREDHSCLWISFKYERLSDFCFDYGKLGHTKYACAKVMSGKASDPRYAFGPRLRAQPLPSLPMTDKRFGHSEKKEKSVPDSNRSSSIGLLLRSHQRSKNWS